MKTIILIRHGKLENPKGIVYNRDSVMAKEDIIHLSKEGLEQMKKMGELLRKKKINIQKIWTSPETRAIESTDECNASFHLSVRQKTDLNETYAPGPYQEKISLDTWTRTGDAYDMVRWGKYHHENPQQTVLRMSRVFWEMAGVLKPGQTGICISHGDPLAWLTADLLTKTIPTYKVLKKKYYLEKGEGMVFVVNDKKEIIDHYRLKNKSL